MKQTLLTLCLILFALPSWGESWDDLVERHGIYYMQFADVPFTGELTGLEQVSFENGANEGFWITYYDNGQLKMKSNYKNGKKVGFWEIFNEAGSLEKTETWKNGERINCEGDC